MHSMDQNTEFLDVKNLTVLKISTICTGGKYFLRKIVNKVITCNKSHHVSYNV